MAHRYESILQEYVVKNNRDLLAFRKLSESERGEMSKDLVESLYKATAERAMRLDYDDVENSKGDITKIKDYMVLTDSIKLLQAMQASMTEKIDDLDVIVNAHEAIIANTANFEQGFRVGNTGVIMLYNNLAMALVASTSFVIATAIDYVKDPVGNYSTHFRNNASKQKGYPTVMIDSLKKFALLNVNGDLAKFFAYSFSKKALVGVGVGAAIVIGALGISIMIVPLIRELVYQFYHMRVSIADYLRLQADFLEMNQSKLNSVKNMKATAKKQENLMKQLTHLADKIDVDQKTSSKQAENELKRENNGVHMTSPVLTTAQNADPYDSLL
jgi:hypothetical protein